VGERRNVLLVPNAALRWSPQPEQIVPAARGKTKQGAEEPSQGQPSAAAGKAEPVRGVVWVPEGSLVRPVRLRLGLTDGSMTEVESGKLQEGASLVVGEMEQQTGKPAPGGSPFAPQLFKQGQKNGGR
jgi:HlyD family secretion protein